MFRSKEAIVLIAMMFVLLAASAWVFIEFGPATYRYRELTNRGVDVEARVVAKEIRPDGRHHVTVAFETADAQRIECGFEVSRAGYDEIDPDQPITVTYVDRDPTTCMPPHIIATSRPFFYALVALAVFAILLVATFARVLRTAFRRPPVGEGMVLTTELGVSEMACPRCRAPMSEGYIPGGYGIAWRDRNEAIGLPGPFNSLPGSTFWFRRPKLHAFRCAECEIITLRYGRN